jgi:hypothetical protein
LELSTCNLNGLLGASTQQKLPYNEAEENARHFRTVMAMRDGRSALDATSKWLNGLTRKAQSDRDDPHKRPVAIAVFVTSTGVLSGRSPCDSREGVSGGATDIKNHVRRSPKSFFHPEHEILPDVFGVELGFYQAIDCAKYQRAIIRPCAFWLVVTAVFSHFSHWILPDFRSRSELNGNSQGVADE